MKPTVLFATGDREIGSRLKPEVADVCQMTVSVSSGQAYAHLQREPYQVFIVDVRLPQLDSVELAHALRHAQTAQGVFVSWGPLNDVVYVSGLNNWTPVVVHRSFPQLVGTLRALLDPAAPRTLEVVRYRPKEDTFFVVFRNGKTYELPRSAIEANDVSAVVGEPRIIHGGSAFEVRQQSGNTYEVPWDLVLYHQEPSYPHHKGSSSQREVEANRAERIGTRIRQEREARGWSLGDLAQRTRIQPPNLSRLENGKHVPSLETLERLAKALGVRVADLAAL